LRLLSVPVTVDQPERGFGLNFPDALARMVIGDSAVNGVVRVDFIHADDAIEPCYTVSVSDRIVFMNDVVPVAAFARRNQVHQDALLRFMACLPVLASEAGAWQLQVGGSGDNPLWEYGVGALVTADAPCLLAGEPVFIDAGTVSECVREDGAITALVTRPGRHATRFTAQRARLNAIYRVHAPGHRNVGSAQLSAINEAGETGFHLFFNLVKIGY